MRYFVSSFFMKNYKFICTFSVTGEAEGLSVFPVLIYTSKFIFSFITFSFWEITFKRNVL